jgi:hypothetical protein
MVIVAASLLPVGLLQAANNSEQTTNAAKMIFPLVFIDNTFLFEFVS